MFNFFFRRPQSPCPVALSYGGGPATSSGPVGGVGEHGKRRGPPSHNPEIPESRRVWLMRGDCGEFVRDRVDVGFTRLASIAAGGASDHACMHASSSSAGNTEKQKVSLRLVGVACRDAPQTTCAAGQRDNSQTPSLGRLMCRRIDAEGLLR